MNHKLQALLLTLLAPIAAAQAPMHHGTGPSTPSTTLSLENTDGKTLTLLPDALAALPHKSVTVLNGHTKATEVYTGVPLNLLLARLGVPQGEDVKGHLYMTGIVAQGTDGYQVLYSLPETDPTLRNGEVIVADTLDGKKLTTEGLFKLVSTGDTRPARWVRNLTAIKVVIVSTTPAPHATATP